jgi:DnaJ-domain-containing protein 1
MIPRTLVAMTNLAKTLCLQCDLAGARELQERVLEESRRVQGEEHPDTLTAMSNLSATLKSLGELVATRKLQEQVLEARRRLLGEEHPDTLTAKNNLARMKLRTLRHWLQLMFFG